MTEIQLPLHQNPQKGMNGKFLPKNTLEIRGGGVGNTNLTSNEIKSNSTKKSSLKLLEKSTTSLTNIQVYPIKLNSNTEKLDPFGTILSVNFIDVKSSTARNPSNLNSLRTDKIIDNNLTNEQNSQMLNNSNIINNVVHNPVWNDESNSGWTSTGVMSDRSSVYSIDDGDFDREASRKVGNQLKAIESVLYEQTSSDSLYLNECKEWLEKFPHLRILGSQIQNYSKDDMLDISKTSTHRNQTNLNTSLSPFINSNKINDSSNMNQLKCRETTDLNNQGLYLNGTNLSIHRITEKELNENREEFDFLEEEILEEDGTYEELLAYDNQEEEFLFEHNKRLNINKRRKHGLPPITPKASMKDLVANFLFDHMWSELIDWSIDLIKDYAKSIVDKELFYETRDRTPVPENQPLTPTPQNPKIDLTVTNETDKTNNNVNNYSKPSIVQLKLFDPPVNNNALFPLNNDKLSDKQSYTPGLSRDNSILYNQNNKIPNNNYEGLLESKFGYSDSVSTVGDLVAPGTHLKEILRIKQINKTGLNGSKNLAPIVNYNRVGSGSRRQQIPNNYKKRYSSIEISSNPLIDKNIIIHGAGFGKTNLDEKSINNSLIINPLNPINLNSMHGNRSANNSTQAYHTQNIDDQNTIYDNDYVEYNFSNYHDHNENSVDEINLISNNANNNSGYNRNNYLIHYSHLKKNSDNHQQLPPIGSSLILKPLRISSANNLKTNKEKSERPLTSTASRHENVLLNKRSTTPSGGKGFNSVYQSNMRITGTRYNNEDSFYKDNNPVNSLSNYLSTKSFATINQNNSIQQGSNRRNSIKEVTQGLQRTHK